MNSSTSSSERRWKRFLTVYLTVLLVVGLVSFGVALIIDPYNTGILTPLDRNLPIHDTPRLGDVGRARDPAFDSAIFGNSTGQLIEPARLDGLIGGRFMSLTVGGTGPVEQLVMMDYFRRHHPGRVRTLIVTMDVSWCAADRFFARDRINNPFPFWLYDDAPLTYLARLVTFESLRLARFKLAALLGHRKLQRPDGYDNFELGRMWRIEEAWQRLDGDHRIMQWMSETDRPSLNSFAALDALGRLLGRFEPAPQVVLAFMPHYAPALPPAGSLTAERIDRCKDRAARLAADHRAGYVDLLRDDRVTREAANFWDPPHYRSHIARAIETALADAVKHPVTNQSVGAN